MKRGVRVLFLLSLFLSESAVEQSEAFGSTNCLPPGYDANIRPDPKGVPTKVSVGIYLLDLVEIKDVEQEFTVDLATGFSWKDSRLVKQDHGKLAKSCNVTLDQVWHPQLQGLNIRKIRQALPDVVEVYPDGTVTQRNQYFAGIASPFKLEDFPFDSQILKISIVSSRFDPEEVTLQISEEETGRADKLSVIDWKIGKLNNEVGTFRFGPAHHRLSQIDFYFHSQRLQNFYVKKIIIPMVLLVVMSWAVFWLNPADLGPQMATASTVILTLIVYLHRVGSLLPRLPYLTRMDEFLLGSFVLGFFAFVEAVTTSILARSGKHDMALRIDFHSRWIFPLGLIIVIIYAFWV